MWAHYRKTLIPIQLAIVSVAVALFLVMKVPLPGVIVFFLAMEIGAVVGAWWGARLKRKLHPDPNQLPLSR